MKEIKNPLVANIDRSNGNIEISIAKKYDKTEEAMYKSYMSVCAMDDKALVDTSKMDKDQTMKACGMQYDKMRAMMNEVGKGGLTELSFFSEDLGGIRAKCRPDWISHDKNIVVDLKTTQDASPKGFQKSIGQFGYHIQAAFYLRTLQNLGFDSYDFIFIAIEKTAPFCVGVYRASMEMLEEGNKKVDEAIDKILWCKENDSYPDYTPNEIETIDLPPWMRKKQEPEYDPNLEQEIQLY